MSTENLIEVKKTINEKGFTPEKPPDYIGFLKAQGRNIITSFIYYLVSGCIVLYLSKLSFANVIPYEFPEIPFTPPPSKNEIPSTTNSDTSNTQAQDIANKQDAFNGRGGAPSQIIETNIVRLGGFFGFGAKEVLSTKLQFDTDTASKVYDTGLLGYLRSASQNPKKATIFGNFLNKVFCDILSTNNSIITAVFSKLYSYLSESIIIIIAPMLLGFYFMASYLINFGLFIVFYVTNIGLIFKEIDKSDPNASVKYNDLTTNGFGWLWIFFNVFIWFILFGPAVTIMPIVMMIFSLLSPLAISGKNVTQPNNNYEMGFGEFCTNVIYYKGQLFLAILSFGLLGQAKTYLGSSGFAGCIAAILFCVFALHLYNLSYDPQKDTNLSPNPSKLHGGGYQKSNKNKRTSKNKKQE